MTDSVVRRVEVETGKVSIFPVFSISEVYRSRFKMADFTPKFDLKSVKNDKDLRKIRLKLDCPSELEWERWKSGREHQKTFYVKNILNKVQTLRWEEPASPYFKTNFQEPHARLNPGMTAAIVVFFFPKSTEEYFSTIPFRTARGPFTLNLRGLLPSVNLGLPVHIDYKYCPVKDITTKTFDIHNDQDFIVGFKWMSVTHPFSITPAQGNLKPGQSATMSCHFCPDDATAYKGTACVGTTTKTTGQVKLFGIGKYTFITLLWQVIPFGDVLNRTSKEMEQVLTNISPVTAQFTIQRVEAWYYGHGNVFTISPMKGSIPSNSSLSLKAI